MQIPYAIIFMGLLIFLSHLFNGLFERTKIPNVLLLLIIGVIIGPVVGWIDVSDFGNFGNIFTTITLIVILFESGINLKFSEIKVAIGSALLLTILNFVAGVAIATFVVNLVTSLDLISSIFVGCIIGGTSSAVVIPMVKQLRLDNKNQTILFLESALSDVLCLVVGLAVLEGMKAGAIDIGQVFKSMGSSFLFAALIGLGLGAVWSILLGALRSLQNSMFISLALVFVIYGLCESLQLNGGIAVLSFGILLGNNGFFNNKSFFKKLFAEPISTFDIHEKRFYSEIVFVLQTYFFVYIGVAIKFEVGAIAFYVVGLVLVAAIILVRPFGIKLVTKKDTKLKDVAIMSVMTPKGLVTAVMASLPLQLGLTGGNTITSLGYSVVLFSILICSILVIILSKDQFIFTKLYGGKDKKNLSPENTEPAGNVENTELADSSENVTELTDNTTTESEESVKKEQKESTNERLTESDLSSPE